MYDLDLFHGINVGYVGKGFPVPLGPIRDIYIYIKYLYAYGYICSPSYQIIKVQPLLLLKSEQFPCQPPEKKPNNQPDSIPSAS